MALDSAHIVEANPGKLSCGAVLGIAPHVMVEYFKVVTGTDMVFVPYKGGPALIPDLLGGRIQVTFGAKSFFLPYIQSGKLRPLAVDTVEKVARLVGVVLLGRFDAAEPSRL